MSELPKSIRTAQCCATCKHCGVKSPYDDGDYLFCWFGAEKPNPPEPSDGNVRIYRWQTGAHFERAGFEVEPGQVCDNWLKMNKMQI